MNKNVFLFAAATLLFISACKEKLPSNISSQVFSVNLYADILNQELDVIMGLKKEDVDKMTIDTIASLLVNEELFEKNYNNEEEKLSELLKYNSKFSDYKEVSNRKKPRYHDNIELYLLNLTYLKKRQLYLINNKEGKMPEYNMVW